MKYLVSLHLLRNLFSRHGLPVTDQGSVFMAKVTSQLCELVGENISIPSPE